MACDLSRATLLRAALPYANTMVDLGEKKSMSLSLRLLREGLTVEQALRDDHELEEQPAEPGRLFGEGDFVNCSGC
jgi:exopolyphosphatase/pppGpp-phosphohydrolase